MLINPGDKAKARFWQRHWIIRAALQPIVFPLVIFICLVNFITDQIFATILAMIRVLMQFGLWLLFSRKR